MIRPDEIWSCYKALAEVMDVFFGQDHGRQLQTTTDPNKVAWMVTNAIGEEIGLVEITRLEGK